MGVFFSRKPFTPALRAGASVLPPSSFFQRRPYANTHLPLPRRPNRPGDQCLPHPLSRPLLVKAGDKLDLSDRESDWPGWIWCSTPAGKSGWVPAADVEPMGQIGLVRCDYDATELSAEVGEELIANDDESGWLRCANEHGQNGWIPIENVERV